jgi:hypothetical protein
MTPPDPIAEQSAIFSVISPPNILEYVLWTNCAAILIFSLG